MSDYEPTAEMVEALAKELHEEHRAGAHPTPIKAWSALELHTRHGRRQQARFVLRRQHERELALREATRMAVIRAFETDTEDGWSDAMVKFRMDAYDAAHAKLDAPKVPEAPTLLEAAKAMLRYPAHEHSERWLALEAAVKREERK